MTKEYRSRLIKAAVLGASDGIITTFAVVAGVVGANLAVHIILILGVANMIADGISMSVGDYLGEISAAQYEQSKSEKQLERKSLWYTSATTFVAFITAGTLPLLPYLIKLVGISIADELQFPLSILCTGMALFLVGSVGTIVTKANWLRSGLQMLGIGAIAAVVAYGLGAYIETLVSK